VTQFCATSIHKLLHEKALIQSAGMQDNPLVTQNYGRSHILSCISLHVAYFLDVRGGEIIISIYYSMYCASISHMIQL